MTPSTRLSLVRVGPPAAIGGAVLLFVATWLHPMSADPNDAPAAFTEYAADRLWVASHLGQFVGIAVLGVALVALAAAMEAGKPAAWARIGLAGTAASVAVAAALQAVDGIALKVMVNRWAVASGETRALAFEGAFAVRQVETGLAGLLSIVFGLTITAFAVAMMASRRFAAWLAWVGLVGALGTFAAGIAQAYTGFSALAMTLSMPAGVVLMLWAVAVGASLRRLAPGLADPGASRA